MSKPHISNPCHENWDSMTPQSGGRHCDTCNKTVIDFTTRSEIEITEFLTKHTGEKLCGRFSEHQLEKTSKPVRNTLQLLYLKVTSIKTTTIRTACVFMVGVLMSLTGCSTSSHNHEVDGMVESNPTFDINDSSEIMMLGEVDVDYENEIIDKE